MRFQVQDWSTHTCCFDCIVIDTSWNRPSSYEELVCECYERETAERIAEALNFFEKYTGDEWAITPSGEIVLA